MARTIADQIVRRARRRSSAVSQFGRELLELRGARSSEVRYNGANELRPVLDGDTHAGVHIELHETELPPGGAPHPPHHHVHEEMILIREGTMEVTISGRSAKLGPGTVAYVASNEEHGWHNAGTTRAHYFVLAIGRD